MDAELQREPLDEVVARENYVPTLLSELATAFMYGGSNLYSRLYGVRINEWRIINAVAHSPGTTASQASDSLGLDRAIASRSIATLKAKGLVVEEKQGARRLYLTRAGVTVQRAIVPISHERTRALLTGLDEAEQAQLTTLLNRLKDNLPLLRELEQSIANAAEPTERSA